ncbi:MAG TPA: hypothetical protein ENJ95_07660 [Bacteroidetes bacterium]|nr:hypothetical protein [Bacteroidota bacterium]
MKTFNPLPIILFLLLPFFGQAQLLEGMKGEVNGGSSSSSEASFDGDSEWFAWLDFLVDFGFAGGYGLLFGFNNEYRPNDKTFNDYPYADGTNGLFLPNGYDDGRLGRMQLLGHFQSNEDKLFGAYFQAKFYADRFLIIDANHLQLFEDLDDGGVDLLSMSNLNLQFNRVHDPKFNLFWGGGLMLLGGGTTYASPSLSGGFTWYFKKPLSIHAESQIGWPNGTYARQHQARVQVHLDRYMIYAGYQGTKVGSVSVANWSMGTGVWF